MDVQSVFEPHNYIESLFGIRQEHSIKQRYKIATNCIANKIILCDILQFANTAHS